MGSNGQIIAWQRAVASHDPSVALLALVWPSMVPRPIAFQLGDGKRTADLVYDAQGAVVVIVREAGRLFAATKPTVIEAPATVVVGHVAGALTAGPDDKLCRDVYRYLKAIAYSYTMTNISFDTARIADAYGRLRMGETGVELTGVLAELDAWGVSP